MPTDAELHEEGEEDVFGHGSGLDGDVGVSSGPVLPLARPLDPEAAQRIAANRASALERKRAKEQAELTTGAEAEPDLSSAPLVPVVSGASPNSVQPSPLLVAKRPRLETTPCQEPGRALNLYLERSGMEVAYTDRLQDATSGAWIVEARAGGIAVRGSARGKKAARREANRLLLQALTDKMS